MEFPCRTCLKYPICKNKTYLTVMKECNDIASAVCEIYNNDDSGDFQRMRSIIVSDTFGERLDEIWQLTL